MRQEPAVLSGIWSLTYPELIWERETAMCRSVDSTGAGVRQLNCARTQAAGRATMRCKRDNAVQRDTTSAGVRDLSCRGPEP
eukprot:14885688-Alexandrium_andersonii.AAC.1